jgi:hypothetical protein
MDYEELQEDIIRELTEEIFNFIGMPEEYIPDYFDDEMANIGAAFDEGMDGDIYAEAFIENYKDGIDLDDYEAAIKGITVLYDSYFDRYNDASEDTGDDDDWDSFDDDDDDDFSLQEETRRDYNVKYTKGNDGPFDEIYKTANGPGTQSAEKKPVIKGTLHFKKDESGYGPIPTTGVGRSDYNVKYSRSGALVEKKLNEILYDSNDDSYEMAGKELKSTGEKVDANGDKIRNNMRYVFKSPVDNYGDDDAPAVGKKYGWYPYHFDRDVNKFTDEDLLARDKERGLENYHKTKYGPRDFKYFNEAARKPGIISPALKESLESWEIKKRLIENKVIDFKDLDILEEDD